MLKLVAFTWGILGAGDIARKHVAAAMQSAPGHRLGAVMRRDAAEAERFARDYGVERWYTDARALVSDPSIDAVFIATPPSSHAELTALAAEHGKHVICEKPIADTPAAAERMIAACQRAGVRLMICHYQRFNRRHELIRQWIHAGAIGRVISARWNFSSYSPPAAGAWRHDPAIAGGGPLMDLGSHCLDLLQYLCGAIERGIVQADTLAWETPVEDTGTILLRLASGAHATVTTHWSTLLPDDAARSHLEIQGSAGSIVAHPLFSKDHSGTLLLHRAEGTEDHSCGPLGRVHEDVIEHFRQAVESGGPVRATPEDALAALRVLQPNG
jgi:predicted dehydrogenase